MDQFPDFIQGLPEADIPFQGVTGHLLQGEDQQVIFMEATEDTPVPEHRHKAQWELVVAGRVDLTMGGETRTYGPGEAFFVPEGAPHSALVHAGFRSVIFFDQADRYRPIT
mgnify:CR=1 FL=1